MNSDLIVSILIKFVKVSIYSLAAIHCFLLFSKDSIEYTKKYKFVEIISLILCIIPATILWVLIDNFNMKEYNAPSGWLVVLLYLPLLIFVIKSNK